MAPSSANWAIIVDELELASGDVQIFEVQDCLLVAIQEDLDDRAVMELQDRLTERISRTHARGVLIDISALDVVDTFIGRKLGSIARMAAILDAASVLVGMRPAVAITLVELGMHLDGVRTALNVDRGLRLIRDQIDGRAGVVLEIRKGPDIAAVRRVVGKAMDGLGATALRRTRIVTAASELARNALVHGGGGRVELQVAGKGSGRGLGIVLTFSDEGKGIADIDMALRDGFTTGGGLGMGLGGAKRLCDEFHISSTPGRGTTVRIASWLKRP